VKSPCFPAVAQSPPSACAAGDPARNPSTGVWGCNPAGAWASDPAGTWASNPAGAWASNPAGANPSRAEQSRARVARDTVRMPATSVVAP